MAERVVRRPETLDPQFLREWLRSGAILTTADGDAVLGAGARSRTAGPAAGAISFYAPDFFLRDPMPFHTFARTRRVAVADLMRRLEDLAGPHARATWSGPSRTLFLSDVREVRSMLARGRLRKVVPVAARRGRFRWNPATRARALGSALREAVAAPLSVYGIWDDDSGVIGATPEMLLETEGSRRARTMALAGTSRPAARRREAPLEHDPKERLEHLIVVRGIRRSLSVFGQVQVGPTGLLHLPGLIHLSTPLSLRGRAVLDPLRVVRVLHPTPALGSSPRAEGLRWLRRADARAELPRGRFGAPFGVFVARPGRGTTRSPGHDARLVVAIRGVQWTGDRAAIFAGCGIVNGSDPRREWEELRAKLDATLAMLRL